MPNRPSRRRDPASVATRVVTFRVSADEHVGLTALAEEAGVTVATLVHAVLERNGILLVPDDDRDAQPIPEEAPQYIEGPESDPTGGIYPFNFLEIFHAPVGELGRARRDAAASGAVLTNRLYAMTVDLMDADIDDATANTIIKEITRYRYPGKNLGTAQEDEALLVLMVILQHAAAQLEPIERKNVRDPVKLANYLQLLKDGDATEHVTEPHFQRLFEVSREAWQDWERLSPVPANQVHWTQLARAIAAAGAGTPKTRTGKLVAKLDALAEIAASAGIAANKRRLREVWRARRRKLERAQTTKKI